jgi:hypothetical protein
MVRCRKDVRVGSGERLAKLALFQINKIAVLGVVNSIALAKVLLRGPGIQ